MNVRPLLESPCHVINDAQWRNGSISENTRQISSN